MKKTFTLILFLVCLALSASAQDKKTWDFTLGVSAETIANLEADPNWREERSPVIICVNTTNKVFD